MNLKKAAVAVALPEETAKREPPCTTVSVWIAVAGQITRRRVVGSTRSAEPGGL